MKFTFTQIRLLRRVLVPMTVLLAAACTKDPMSDNSVPSGSVLRFAVTQSDGWNTVGSRAAGYADGSSADGPRFAGVFMLQGKTPTDTLFLHATVTDGIEGAHPSGGHAEEGVTRAAPLTGGKFYESFGVYAYLASVSATGWSAADKSLYMNNVEVSETSGWATDYRWPGSDCKIRFFAYAPYGNANIGIGDVGGTQSSNPSFTYTVPEAAADQTDLLVAASDVLDGDHNQAADLTFRHALAAVKFAAANDLTSGSLTIKSIALEGIDSRGTLAVDDTGSWVWGSLGTPVSFTQSINYQVKTDNRRELIIDGEKTFMMIPQSFGTNAAIVVTIEEPHVGERELRMSLSGESAWQSGKTYTYTISSASVMISEIFEVSIAADGEYPYKGGSRAISVDSYVEVSSSKMNNGAAIRTPVPWTASLANGTDWVELGCTAEQLKGGTVSFDATVAEQKNKETATPHNDRLKARSPIGRDTKENEECRDRIDLSTSYRMLGDRELAETPGNIAYYRETANCYIVNRPGYYFIPAVFGNAQIGSESNKTAYQVNGVSAAPFYNPYGNLLTTPSIQTGLTGTKIEDTKFSVELIWQSSPSLITKMFYTSNPDCSICFNIEQESIHQGNALIGLYHITDNGTKNLVWTWHIWVTDYLDLDTYAPTDYNPQNPVSDIEITNHEGVNFTIMSVNLGWVNGPITTFPGRTADVVFRQFDKDGTTVLNTKTITIKQKEQSIEIEGHNPFYQWGRQVPLQGIVYDSGSETPVDETLYDIDGNALPNMSRAVGTNVALANYNATTQQATGVMQNPTTFYTGLKWTYGLGPRFWNSAHNTTGSANPNLSVYKTIYDPCPRGYRVSDVDTYTGTTVSGSYYYDTPFLYSQINTPFHSEQDYEAISGWLFYANSNKDVVFSMRATGNRNSDSGQQAGFGVSTNYWTNRMKNSGPNGAYTSISTGIQKTGVLPYTDGNNCTFGLSVRCIRDNVSGRDPSKSVTLTPLWKGGGEIGIE